MPGNCVVRAETSADHSAIAEVTRLAFSGRQVEVDMIDAIRNSDEYVPSLSLVAELNGEIVGHCMLSRKRMSGRAAPPVLVLGPLGVHPSRQRAGIGSQLVRAAQDAAKLRGQEALIVLLGEPGYYPRFGFRRASEFGIAPDSAAAMAFPLMDGLEEYRGTEIPTRPAK